MAATTSFVFAVEHKKTIRAIEYLDGETQWANMPSLNIWSVGTNSALCPTQYPVHVTPQGHVVFCDPAQPAPHRIGGPAIILNTGTQVWAENGQTTRVEFSDGVTWVPTP
jgi:hypothetical protein